MKRLTSGKSWPQIGFPRHIGKMAMDLDRFAVTVEAEDLRRSGARLNQAEQEADCCGLSCPVGAEKADHLTSSDFEVESPERVEIPVAFG
jgi:hypothetical protein